MMFNRLRSVSGLSLLAIIVVACGDNSGPASPDGDKGIQPTGVQAVLSGAVSGAFDAKGDPRIVEGNLVFQDYAVAVKAGGGTNITAIDKNGETAKGIVLMLPSVAVGEYQIGAACLSSGGMDCVAGVITLDLVNLGNVPDGKTYWFTSGTLRVTKSTADGIEASFTATAEQDPEIGTDAIQLMNGKIGLQHLGLG